LHWSLAFKINHLKLVSQMILEKIGRTTCIIRSLLMVKTRSDDNLSN